MRSPQLIDLQENLVRDISIKKNITTGYGDIKVQED